MMTIRTYLTAAATGVAILTMAFSAGAREIKIATEGAYPPFNMKNAKGELIGFDVDIAKALCAQMKAKCQIVAQNWDGIIPGLLQKKYDLIVASMSITDKRKKRVAFSDPYYSNYLRFVAKKGGGFQADKQAMKGKVVGAQRATVSSQHLRKAFKGIVTAKLYAKQTAAWLDLKNGRLDAVLVDIYPAYDWIKKNPGYEFVGKQIDINDKIAIAARKGDKALLADVNKALKAIVANGTYAKINKKYFPFSIR